jgi:hypothetical protein
LAALTIYMPWNKARSWILYWDLPKFRKFRTPGCSTKQKAKSKHLPCNKRSICLH